MHPLWHEIKSVDTGKKALRSFGWVVGGVLVGIAAVAWWRNGFALTMAVAVLGGLGAALTVLGLTVPVILKPIYRVWMALAVVLGFVMTRVLLTLVYYLVMTPIGLVMRLLGKDPLHRKSDPAVSSYWIEKTYPDDGKERLERYF